MTRPVLEKNGAFVQAVRRLERAAVEAAAERGETAPVALGRGDDPAREAVRLRSALDLGYPEREIREGDGAAAKAELTTTVMGLTGAAGVLPDVYSQFLLEARRSGNQAAIDFFDMFNHRSLSLFVRAFDKYRAGVDGERRGDPASAPVLAVLDSLVGMGLPSLATIASGAAGVQRFFAGHFAQQPRTAAGLAAILSDRFAQPIEILSFQGRWRRLDPDSQTRLGAADGFATLGEDTMLGDAIFDVQGGLRVRIGPMDYPTFADWLARPEQIDSLTDIVRVYAGPEFDFDVQLVLAAGDRPQPQLTESSALRIGLNGWLGENSDPTTSEDTVFHPEDIETRS